MTLTNNYLPTVIEQDGRTERVYDVYSRLMKDRIIFIGTEVSDYSVNAAIAQLLFLVSTDSKSSIKIYINSPGGSILDGDGLLDTMDYVKSQGVDIETYCIGKAASFGALILANGTPGRRYVLPRSRVMIHEPRGGSRGTATDMRIEMELMQNMKDDINAFLAKTTGKSVEEIAKITERDFWMKGQEAVDFGIADEVLNVTPKA